jgi:hypothetical protein
MDSSPKTTGIPSSSHEMKDDRPTKRRKIE